jgi:molybdopterin/thiamine biosynthesis adenylyltransferase
MCNLVTSVPAATPHALDTDRRYVRQIKMVGFGDAAQARLAASKVLVIGAGGLGSPLLSYLAAAGVGTLGIIDDDRVELSNLNRQILHETADIGRKKTDSARDRLEELNPDCHILPLSLHLDDDNAAFITAGYDVIADGSDNFTTRFAVNRAAITQRIPLVSAAVRRWGGQISTFAPHLADRSGCYQCFVSPDAPEINSCREEGVIGAACGVLGSLQALEVINTLLGAPKLVGKLLLFNGEDFSQRIIQLPCDPACAVCSNHNSNSIA